MLMDRVFITPLANKLASLNSIDINKVKGTGPRGRITKIDIEKHMVTSASANEINQTIKSDPALGMDHEVVDIPKIRRIIAEKLTISKSSIPHFYLRRKAKVDQLIDFRRKANEAIEEKKS